MSLRTTNTATSAMVRRLFAVLTLALCAVVVSGCTDRQEDPAEAVSWETMPKIDFHTHYVYERDYLIPLLEKWNMRAVTVDLIIEGERNMWGPMLDLHEKYPDRILLCTTIDASLVDATDFAQQVIDQLKQDFEKGAVMVKVWKNIGLIYKDASGEFIQVDDPRFQPIWDFLVEEDVPVLAHIGEPRAAWLPLDEKSPHYDYYANHPQYHFYNSADVPDWETVMAARDRWVANNPDLTIIGAHLGSMAYDVDEIAMRLDSFPNFYVGTAERFGDLANQSSEKVREFFVEYSDRILYGTDLVTWDSTATFTEEELREEETEYMEKRFRVHWEYLAGADSVEFVRTGTPFRTMTQGLNLPPDVLRAVYHDNAARVLDLDEGDRRGSPAGGAGER